MGWREALRDRIWSLSDLGKDRVEERPREEVQLSCASEMDAKMDHGVEVAGCILLLLCSISVTSDSL